MNASQSTRMVVTNRQASVQEFRASTSVVQPEQRRLTVEHRTPTKVVSQQQVVEQASPVLNTVVTQQENMPPTNIDTFRPRKVKVETKARNYTMASSTVREVQPRSQVLQTRTRMPLTPTKTIQQQVVNETVSQASPAPVQRRSYAMEHAVSQTAVSSKMASIKKTKSQNLGYQRTQQVVEGNALPTIQQQLSPTRSITTR